jgi:hypothetical protein
MDIKIICEMGMLVKSPIVEMESLKIQMVNLNQRNVMMEIMKIMMDVVLPVRMKSVEMEL